MSAAGKSEAGGQTADRRRPGVRARGQSQSLPETAVTATVGDRPERQPATNTLGHAIRDSLDAQTSPADGIFGLAVLLAFVAVNVVAFNQAWSMTHFAASGTRTSRPEELSFLDKVQVGLIGVRLPKPANALDPGHLGLVFETVRLGGSSGAELEGWFVPHAEPKGIVLFARVRGLQKQFAA